MKENLFWQIVAGLVPTPNAARLLGWQFLKHERLKREVLVEFDASSSLTNPLGNIQGGMLSAMLDDCMGPAIYASLDEHQVALTVKMATAFLRPALPGHITGMARFYRRCGNYCYTKGELKDCRGRTLATATACYKVVDISRCDGQ